MINTILNEIKKKIKENIPILTLDQKNRMYRIINSDNPNFQLYGLIMKKKESIAKEVFKKYNCSYKDAIEIFKILISSNN